MKGSGAAGVGTVGTGKDILREQEEGGRCSLLVDCVFLLLILLLLVGGRLESLVSVGDPVETGGSGVRIFLGIGSGAAGALGA